MTKEHNCFNCQYFSQTVDSYICWLNDKPKEITIMENCPYWEDING